MINFFDQELKIQNKKIGENHPTFIIAEAGVNHNGSLKNAFKLIYLAKKAEADAVDVDQWFDTGDVSVLYPDGTMQITDRVKDVIKSGGEWIS